MKTLIILSLLNAGVDLNKAEKIFFEKCPEQIREYQALEKESKRDFLIDLASEDYKPEFCADYIRMNK